MDAGGKMQALGVALLMGLLLAGCGKCEEGQASVAVPSWAKVAPEQIAEAKKHRVPVAFENDLGMRFVLIPAGTVRLATPESDEEPAAEAAEDRERMLREPLKPLRPSVRAGKVTVARPFYMQITEVTEAQYEALGRQRKRADSDGTGGDAEQRPVTGVSRQEAAAFAERIGCRLPTEAEWDRAAQAGGGGSAFPWGGADDAACRNGPGAEDGYEELAPVASFAPTDYGLYDVVGNVWEYCSDKVVLEGIGPVDELPVLVVQTEPSDEAGDEAEQPKTSPFWIIRGGSWRRGGEAPGTLARAISSPYRVEGEVDVGFRLVSPLPGEGE